MNRCVLIVCCTLSLLFGRAVEAVDDTWQAGVARAKITPSEPMWMSGYASRNKPAEGTLHDLWAKALVIRDPDGNTAVMVSLDLVGIGRDISVPVCRTICEKHQLQRSQIAIFTSHTHTGPVIGRNLSTMYDLPPEQQRLVDGYSEFLRSTIVSVVENAFSDIAPAHLAWGRSHASFAVNRRNNREADVPMLRKKGELKGPVDHSVQVLTARAADGRLRAVVFGYACHATVLSYYKWSGDWPGFAQLEIEKQFPGAVALFMAGCGADQNPLPRRTEELAADYGRQAATAVKDAISNHMQPITGRLATAFDEIPLKLAALPSRDDIEKDLQSSNRYIVLRAKQLLKQLDSEGRLRATYPYPVQVWRLGHDAYLVILGGEVVVDYSLRLQNELSDLNLWVAAYANDVMAYIPSLRVLKEGGYEGATSMIYYGLPTTWSEDVEEQVVQAVRRLVHTVAEPK